MNFNIPLNESLGSYNSQGVFNYNTSYIVQELCSQFSNNMFKFAGIIMLSNFIILALLLYLFNKEDLAENTQTTLMYVMLGASFFTAFMGIVLTYWLWYAA